MTERFQLITPFLWFDGQAEDAAKLYTSVFPNCASSARRR
jgi:predicted 3-demethylubiquinone-9 3-methyltransferase (glyoxalase superfamily)